MEPSETPPESPEIRPNITQDFDDPDGLAILKPLEALQPWWIDNKKALSVALGIGLPKLDQLCSYPSFPRYRIDKKVYYDPGACIGWMCANPLASPPIGTFFDRRMTGSWITIGADQNASPPGPGWGSYNVGTYISPTQLRLQVPPPAAMTGVTYYGNCLPMALRMAILFLAAHFYETREPVVTGRGEVAVEIPGTLDDMLVPYRIFESCDVEDQGGN